MCIPALLTTALVNQKQWELTVNLSSSNLNNKTITQ